MSLMYSRPESSPVWMVGSGARAFLLLLKPLRPDSSPLSRSLADQGVKTRIRKGIRLRKHLLSASKDSVAGLSQKRPSLQNSPALQSTSVMYPRAPSLDLVDSPTDFAPATSPSPIVRKRKASVEKPCNKRLRMESPPHIHDTQPALRAVSSSWAPNASPAGSSHAFRSSSEQESLRATAPHFTSSAPTSTFTSAKPMTRSPA
jgi:hypothetical protein